MNAEKEWKPKLVQTTLNVFHDRTNEILTQLHHSRHGKDPNTASSEASIRPKAILGDGFSSPMSDLPLRLMAESLTSSNDNDVSSTARKLKQYVSHKLMEESKQAVGLLRRGGTPSELVRVDPVETVSNEYEKLVDSQVDEIAQVILQNIVRGTIASTIQSIMR